MVMISHAKLFTNYIPANIDDDAYYIFTPYNIEHYDKYTLLVLNNITKICKQVIIMWSFKDNIVVINYITSKY